MNCPQCKSSNTVAHGSNHPLKPGFLHCNNCGFCGRVPVPAPAATARTQPARTLVEDGQEEAPPAEQETEQAPSRARKQATGGGA